MERSPIFTFLKRRFEFRSPLRFAAAAFVLTIAVPSAALEPRRLTDAELASCPGGKQWLDSIRQSHGNEARRMSPSVPRNPALRQQLMDWAGVREADLLIFPVKPASAVPAIKAAQSKKVEVKNFAAVGTAAVSAKAAEDLAAAAAAAADATDAAAAMDPVAIAAAEKLDKQRLEHMREFVRLHGVPSFDEVGYHGMYAFWRLLGSASGDPDFQLSIAEQLIEKDGDLGTERNRVIELIDELLTRLHKSQRYGTRFKLSKLEPDGYWMLEPVENAADLESRRAAQRMMPAEVELCIRQRFDFRTFSRMADDWLRPRTI